MLPNVSEKLLEQIQFIALFEKKNHTLRGKDMYCNDLII